MLRGLAIAAAAPPPGDACRRKPTRPACWLHPSFVSLTCRLPLLCQRLADFEAIVETLVAVGEAARACRQRLTAHPSHYVQLASVRKGVVESSLRHLELNARVSVGVGVWLLGEVAPLLALLAPCARPVACTLPATLQYWTAKRSSSHDGRPLSPAPASAISCTPGAKPRPTVPAPPHRLLAAPGV